MPDEEKRTYLVWQAHQKARDGERVTALSEYEARRIVAGHIGVEPELLLCRPVNRSGGS